MKITLVRHTPPEVKEGVCYGQTDLHVDDTFKNHLDAIQEVITLDDDTVCFTSPLVRCKLLCKALAGGERAIEEDKRLMELNFGSWENKKWSSLPVDQMQEWGKDYLNSRVHGGESMIDLNDRVKAFWTDLIESNYSEDEDEEKNILIVTHAGVIRSILHILLEMPLKKAFSILVNYGGVVQIEMLDKENAQIEFKR
ncbi:alpha-ribazole phosphatase family protein [Halosquirtibacter xylanolyticus]|uniref:alpha-ribazole phosphatase family protein n=1 Tax=Halosquirtibacter xylanolyticus TaxID=3374599 RepID=UPI0037478621|nr:alpha-ribazole phosphatase family protein [Prolixibacteraceae bacterium]